MLCDIPFLSPRNSQENTGLLQIMIKYLNSSWIISTACNFKFIFQPFIYSRLHLTYCFYTQ
jgi:hypothetical protein